MEIHRHVDSVGARFQRRVTRRRQVVTRVDLTLPTGQQRFLQVLVGVGPVFSFFASCPKTFESLLGEAF